MEIPGLGYCEADDDMLYSDAITIPALNSECEFLLEDYLQDEQKEDFHQAIAHFIGLSKSQLHAAEPHIFAYYQDVAALPDIPWEMPVIHAPHEVWQHITFGFEAEVRRQYDGTQAVCISLGCHCDWEPEHGLQLVFKHGHVISKVGPYDGHMSNAYAYANPALENVIYRRRNP